MEDIIARQKRISASELSHHPDIFSDDPVGGPPEVRVVPPLASPAPPMGPLMSAMYAAAQRGLQMAQEEGFTRQVPGGNWFCFLCDKSFDDYNVETHCGSKLHCKRKEQKSFHVTRTEPRPNDWNAAWGYCDPAKYEWRSEQGQYWCRLCWKYVDDPHMASDKHKKKVAFADHPPPPPRSSTHSPPPPPPPPRSSSWTHSSPPPRPPPPPLGNQEQHVQDRQLATSTWTPPAPSAPPAQAVGARCLAEDWSQETWRETEMVLPMQQPHARNEETGAVDEEVPEGDSFFERF